MRQKEAASNWAERAWDFLYEKGITDGAKPKENMTREEFLVMLKRIEENGVEL